MPSLKSCVIHENSLRHKDLRCLPLFRAQCWALNHRALSSTYLQSCRKKKKKRSVRQNRYFYTQLRDEDVEVQNGRPRNSTNLNRGDWIAGGGGFLVSRLSGLRCVGPCARVYLICVCRRKTDTSLWMHDTCPSMG